MATETNQPAPGAFSQRFARKKAWAVDESLWRALEAFCTAELPFGSTVTDLGAGTGLYVEKFAHMGYKAIGFDGIQGIEELSQGRVKCIDLSRPLSNRYNFPADLVLTIEVGEHIPRTGGNCFLDTIARLTKRFAIVSWAVPGQKGRDHIACRLPEWVACELGRRGLELHEDWTAKLRAIAGRGWSHKLLVFKRRGIQ